MRELNVGDKVFIKEDLKCGVKYGYYTWINGMKKGWQEVIKILPCGSFRIKNDLFGCSYTPEMIDWHETIKRRLEKWIPENSAAMEYLNDKVKKEITKGVREMVKEKFLSNINLKYDGDILQGKIDGQDVKVERSKKDTPDLEKACMMAILKAIGFNYGDVKKVMENVKIHWKPANGEKYYSIYFAEMKVVYFTWVDYKTDNRKYTNGLCFRTKEEAEEKLEQIKEILKK